MQACRRLDAWSQVQKMVQLVVSPRGSPAALFQGAVASAQGHRQYEQQRSSMFQLCHHTRARIVRMHTEVRVVECERQRGGYPLEISARVIDNVTSKVGFEFGVVKIVMDYYTYRYPSGISYPCSAILACMSWVAYLDSANGNISREQGNERCE